jgi:hypothetical protein
MSENENGLTVGGQRITEDAYGNFCLKDLYYAAGSPPNKEPKDWKRLQTTTELAIALLKRVGYSHPISDNQIKTVLYNRPGRGKGIFAHPILAGAYASYLDPEKGVETIDVWLRYRGGDATLADEILENSTELANEWAARRAMARVVRKHYASTLASHGVKDDLGIGMCTNAIYIELLGAKAPTLKKRRKVPANGNLRDTFDLVELTGTMLSEAMSAERIEDEKSEGRYECRDASQKSAHFVAQAIKSDRSQRLRREEN